MVHPHRLPLLPASPRADNAILSKIQPLRPIRYLRVVLTARCNLSCSFCHMEGDPGVEGIRGGLATEDLQRLLLAASGAGIRKLKFLGGEPLLRADLPKILRPLRDAFPGIDLSLITAGAVPSERLDACYQAGLSRCNVSIHGWSPATFAARTGASNPRLYELRQCLLETAVNHRRPLKLNYVYTGPHDETDLGALLTWAAGRPLVVNVLNDLHQPELTAEVVEAVVRRLRGVPCAEHLEPDPFSLPTRHLHWSDGLEVEIKHQHLGEQGAYRSCASCAEQRRCTEGILALRLTHTGELRPCMDRPDLGFPLLPLLHRGSVAEVASLFGRFTGNVPLSELPQEEV
jgi:molybdenum cofactor biosynthesis enzyme MoaA